MKVAILSGGDGWHVQELQRALAARGHTVARFPIQRLVGRIEERSGLYVRSMCLDDWDVVLVRTIPRGSLEQIIFRVDALHLLEVRGVRVVNPPEAIERTVNKYYTSGLLAQAGLPTPRTVVCEQSDDALEAFEALGGDVIVKPLFGSMGFGMVRIQSPDVAYRVFKALELERAVYYLQEAVPHGGRDIRAFVLGDRVLAAIERVADGWRTNVAQGARVQPVRLTPEQEGLCLRAVEVVGTEYAGVDLLPGLDGICYVLEVNGIPGWRGLQTTTDRDIAAEIVAYLEATRS